jgi:RNA polymerase sigma-70 factor (ECF subfamily)
MNGVGDEQLVDLFVNSGEMRHFNELVCRHISKVRSMIYPIVLNNADADDLTQEVFVRVARSISGFRKRAGFSTWLHRIAMNTTYSFLRKKSRNPVDNNIEAAEQADNSSDPSGAMMTKETDSQISRALACLSASLRSAITLTAIHGMNVKEAAAAEGCLAATMYWRVHEARKRLRGKLVVPQADPPRRKT